MIVQTFYCDRCRNKMKKPSEFFINIPRFAEISLMFPDMNSKGIELCYSCKQSFINWLKKGNDNG